VKRFEAAFAERHQVPHALATTSCTTALHLALKALNVGPGDEVIVPAFTWIATANVVVHCGATPVFADVRPDTYNIDPESVAARITPRTRAIIAVHLFGLCVDVEELARVLPKGVAVVEDAACAAGADLRGRPAGSIGDLAAFSFHPRKSITCGEGGMLTLRDPKLAARAEMLRNHGAVLAEEKRHVALRPYELPDFEETGYNYRMTDLQAAVGVTQLRKLDTFINERTRLADAYDAALSKLQWISPPMRPTGFRHALQAYVARMEKDAPVSRDEMLAKLHEAGIGARPGTHSVVGLSVYRKQFSTEPFDFPVATALQADTIALPLHNHMTLADVERVAGQMRAIAQGARA
jgi:dTDP-4-amino-4,6-dideoxygalactose transaminase